MHLSEWWPGQPLIDEHAVRRKGWVGTASVRLTDGQLWSLRPLPAANRASKGLNLYGVRGISRDGTFLDGDDVPIVELQADLLAIASLFGAYSIAGNYHISFLSAFRLCGVSGHRQSDFYVAVHRAFVEGPTPVRLMSKPFYADEHGGSPGGDPPRP